MLTFPPIHANAPGAASRRSDPFMSRLVKTTTKKRTAKGGTTD